MNPTSVLDGIVHGLDVVTDMANKAITWKRDIDSDVIDLIEKHVPEAARPLAKKVYESVPEGIFCGCAIMEVATLPALIFWAGRVTILSLPAFMSAMRCNLGIPDMGTAVMKWAQQQPLDDKETILVDGIKTAAKNYVDLCNSFRTALLVWCAVIGATHSTLGWLQSDRTKTLKGILASIVFQTLLLRAPESASNEI